MELKVKKDYEENNRQLLVLYKDLKGFKIRKEDFRRILTDTSDSPFISYFWRVAERKVEPIGKIHFFSKGKEAEVLVEGEKVAKARLIVDGSSVRGIEIEPYTDYPNLKLLEDYLKGKLKEFLAWEHPSKVSYHIGIFLKKNGGIPLSRSGNFYVLRDNPAVKKVLKEIARAGNVDPFLFLKPEKDSMQTIKNRVLSYVLGEYNRLKEELERLEEIARREDISVAEALSIMPKIGNFIYEVSKLKITVKQLCPIFLEEESVNQLLGELKRWKEIAENTREYLKKKVIEAETGEPVEGISFECKSLKEVADKTGVSYATLKWLVKRFRDILIRKKVLVELSYPTKRYCITVEPEEFVKIVEALREERAS